MNRARRSGYQPPRFPAEPVDAPRRTEISLIDLEQSERGEYASPESPEDEAAVSEGWPLSRPDRR